MYQYENGTTRWRKFNGNGDVISYRAPKGWEATADLIEHHPITGTFLGRAQWWIMEVWIMEVKSGSGLRLGTAQEQGCVK